MKHTLILLCLALGACQVRSISDPGLYRSSNRLYQGELRALDVLGEYPLQASTEFVRPRIEAGSHILLIQSGALLPDNELEQAFAAQYGERLEITTLSGIPQENRPRFAEGLRNAARRGAVDTIVCVWGVLETRVKSRNTKAVSWVPVLGWSVPDEELDARIRLRFVVMDVRTGCWDSVSPEPERRVDETTPVDRGLGGGTEDVSADQTRLLKRRAYRSAVAVLARELRSRAASR